MGERTVELSSTGCWKTFTNVCFCWIWRSEVGIKGLCWRREPDWNDGDERLRATSTSS